MLFPLAETLCGIGGTPLSILTARDARPAQVGRLLIKGAFMDLDALRTAGVDVIETSPERLPQGPLARDTLAMLTRGERPALARGRVPATRTRSRWPSPGPLNTASPSSPTVPDQASAEAVEAETGVS